MNSMTRNVLAVIVGLVVGAAVNMGLVNIGPMVIPVPAGADVTTMEGLKESMNLFAPKNFLFPFLAHALGTLVGAFVAAKLAATHQMRCAMIIGLAFLIGGIAMVVMVGGPIWFMAADLLLAYLPMAYLGGLMAGKKAA
ncbi:hypothetical protein [Marinicella litoralis]|uniref:Uncharacterized protein n=1 Tax=Marinicella litoralis TaxID=644220 RepID=A0A4R6XXY9_9GAMM|nr:hypothetical protein [Marinicella litoralis]TDR23489.1 hypothetical protein C8D91_0351 [Marinicella litoralis]